MNDEPMKSVDLGKHLTDINMGWELFEASPDGRAWHEEIERRIDALPDAEITIDLPW